MNNINICIGFILFKLLLRKAKDIDWENTIKIINRFKKIKKSISKQKRFIWKKIIMFSKRYTENKLY